MTPIISSCRIQSSTLASRISPRLPPSLFSTKISYLMTESFNHHSESYFMTLRCHSKLVLLPDPCEGGLSSPFYLTLHKILSPFGQISLSMSNISLLRRSRLISSVGSPPSPLSSILPLIFSIRRREAFFHHWISFKLDQTIDSS